MEFVDIFGHTFVRAFTVEDIFGCFFIVIFEVAIFTFGLEYFFLGIFD